MEIIPDIPEEREIQLKRTEFLVDKIIDQVCFFTDLSDVSCCGVTRHVVGMYGVCVWWGDGCVCRWRMMRWTPMRWPTSVTRL